MLLIFKKVQYENDLSIQLYILLRKQNFIVFLLAF